MINEAFWKQEKLTLGGSNVFVSGMRQLIIKICQDIYRCRKKYPLDVLGFLH